LVVGISVFVRGMTGPVSDAVPEGDPSGGRGQLLLALAIGLAAAVLAAYARHISVARPGVTTQLGFYRGFDQGSYLRTARLLARWRFPTRHFDYEYGLGYPILGVPFIWLGLRGDPFAVVDAVAFGATVSLTFVLGLRVTALDGHARGEVIAVGAALVLAASSPLLNLASSPWNSNIVVALGLLVLVLVTSTRELSPARCAVVGLAIGWVFATRYVDALFLGAPAAAALIGATSAQRRRLLLFGGSALLVVVTLVLLSQQYTFGNLLTTPYHFHHRATGAAITNDQSLGQYRISSIPTHFLGTFVTGKQNGIRVPGDPLLRQFPLLLLAPIGAWHQLRTRARQPWVWIAALGGSLVGSLLYLSFAAGGAGDLAFANARYWAPWYPLWALYSVVGLIVGVNWLTNVASSLRTSRAVGETKRSTGERSFDAPDRT
jgi:hypothetical protein